MTEMIKRVAEAMRLRAIERGHPIHPAMAHHLAAAAIEAMREPTEGMYRAAYAANGGKWADDEYEPPPKVCWREMIGAALNCSPQERTDG